MASTARSGSSRSTEFEDDAFRNPDEDEFFNSIEGGDLDVRENNNAFIPRNESSNVENELEEEETSRRSGRTGTRDESRRKIIQAQMLSYKQKGSYDIPEDVYAFITVAPWCSAPFYFACAVIGIKFVVYTTLTFEIEFINSDKASKTATIVKFFLIPVAVAMQQDLMTVYAGLANARYDPQVLEISKAATKGKFALAYLLRLLDGLFSLTVNFCVMLSADDVLNVFLNFAALHFLQDIDDVFYSLVEMGFFGDDMEHMATVCKQITWPRRAGTTKLSKFVTNLDTILFGLTLLTCVIVFFVFIFFIKDGLRTEASGCRRLIRT